MPSAYVRTSRGRPFAPLLDVRCDVQEILAVFVWDELAVVSEERLGGAGGLGVSRNEAGRRQHKASSETNVARSDCQGALPKFVAIAVPGSARLECCSTATVMARDIYRIVRNFRLKSEFGLSEFRSVE